jgi:two-component system, LytTR family, sensor kinase
VRYSCPDMTDSARPLFGRRRGEWAAACGFWLFLSAISVVQLVWLSRTPGQRVDVGGAIAWQVIYLVAWIPFTIGVWHLTREWLPERFGGWLRVVLAHVPVATGVVLAHTALVAVLATTLAMDGMSMSIAQRFVMQLRGQLTAELLIYTAIAGSGLAMTLYERYRDRQVAAANLQAELAAARLQALRGHLQPHFLFNSLHSIAALARAGDTDGVVRLIAALSDLLRHVLDAGDRHASLHEELQIVERYLEIQHARFADRLTVTIDLAPDVADARVPLLVVQPLVENAIRHGLAPQVRAESLLIRAARVDGFTRIDVEDTGLGLPSGWTLTGARGTGLQNLASRLAAEFGDAAALDVAPREGGGVRARVTLPYVPS